MEKYGQVIGPTIFTCFLVKTCFCSKISFPLQKEDDFCKKNKTKNNKKRWPSY